MMDLDSRNTEVSLKDILASLTRVENQLDQLQVNTGGEKRHESRPVEGKVTCKVRCNILTVGDIDTIKQEFWAVIYLSVQWREDKVKGKTSKDVDWNQSWDPQLYFVNAVNIHQQERWHTIIDKDDGSTDVKLSIRMMATFHTNMQLHSFPHDYQELIIKIMSDWPKDKVEFENDLSIKDKVRTDTFTDGDEWTLHDHVFARPVEESKEMTGAVNEFPHYHISMHVQRNYTCYLRNITRITTLILVLSFASFSIHESNAEARFGVTISLLLTAVAYKFVITSKLPEIPYHTLLDKHVNYCLYIHALMVGQNAVVLILASCELNQKVIAGVNYASLGFLTLVTLSNVAYFRWTGTIKEKEASVRMKDFQRMYLEQYGDIGRNGDHIVDMRQE